MDVGYDTADGGEMFHTLLVLPSKRVLDDSEFGEVRVYVLGHMLIGLHPDQDVTWIGNLRKS